MGAVRLHVECGGTGPGVVLAHGFGGSARNWGPQARGLAARYRVCRFDARGHARSEAPADAGAYSLGTFVEDFDTVARTASDFRVVAGGLSLGAVVALAWAAEHGDRARGVVLASPPAGARAGGGFAAVATAFADAIERDGLEAAGARFVWGPGSGLDPAGARLVRSGFLEHPPHGLAFTLRGVIARLPDLAPLARRVAAAGVPILVVAGDRDEPALEAGRRLAPLGSGVRVEVVPGAGHVVNLERPAVVTALLEAWLATLPA